jgi:cation diffusion facilitator family transporter
VTRVSGARIAAITILVGIVVLAMKTAAWLLTGSAALFSDAAETVVNVIASALAFGAVRFADRPADANHPYGHEKAEFFAAVIEGALIVVAAIVILHSAWTAFLDPQPLHAPLLGMALNAASSVINAAWAWVLLRTGKRLRSAALTADGHHLLSDVVTSAGVLLGVALVVTTGLQWLDPAVAAAAAVYVLVAGMRVISHSVSGLMDTAPPEDVIQRVRAVVREHAAGALEAHDLRMRHAGRLTFLDFHLVVPGEMTVADSHDICDRIESALRAEVEGLQVTIHVEPEAKAKHHGVLVL